MTNVGGDTPEERAVVNALGDFAAQQRMELAEQGARAANTAKPAKHQAPPAVALLGMAAEQLTDQKRDRPLDDLLPWVEWLVRTHELGNLWPECWWKHEGFVQEVVALRAWHDAALHDPAVAGHAIAAWYDYGFWPFHGRTLKERSSICGGKHTDTDHHAQQSARVIAIDRRQRPPGQLSGSRSNSRASTASIGGSTA